MAQLTGVMTADFSEFLSESDKAIGKLKDLNNAAEGTDGGIQDVTVSVDQLGDTAKPLPGIFDGIGQAMASAFTIGALTGFLREVVQLTAEVNRMAAQTGLSVTAVQQLQAVADQTQTPISALTGAIQAMLEQLGKDDRSGINGALAQLGINLEEFDAASTEEKMYLISDAIRDVTDDTKKAALEAEIFGGKWRTVAPAVEADMRSIAEASTTMSETTVANFDWMGNVSSKFWTDFKAAAATGISDIINVLSGNPFAELESNTDKITPKVGAAAAAFDKYATSGKGAALSTAEYNQITKDSTATLDRLNVTMSLVEPKIGSLAQFTRSAGQETERLKDYVFQATDALEPFNSGLTFTSEVIGELPADINAVSAALGHMTAEMESAPFLGPKGGGGTVDTSGITIPNMDELVKRYTATHSGPGVGGVTEDILTYGLRSGLATKSGGGFNAPSISNVFNIVDTESGIARRVGDTLTGQLQRGSLVN